MDDFLTPKQLAQRLNLSSGTLANWRGRQMGPPFVRLGKVIRYAMADVLAWTKGKR